jgi:hypothetical protein
MIVEGNEKSALLLGGIQLRELAVLHDDDRLAPAEMIFDCVLHRFRDRSREAFGKRIEFFFTHVDS